MKSEALKEQGLTDEQIKFVMAENGKDVEKAKGNLNDVIAERDKYKSQAESAEETLKKFEGVDVEAFKNEVESWKKKAEEDEKRYTAELHKRDFADALKSELADVKFSSEAAKESIMNKIENAGLKLSEGKILGLTDLLSQMREKDSSAFIDKAEESKPRFTQGNGGSQGNGTPMTKDDILKIKDASQRQQAIAANIGLFRKGD